MTGLEMLAILAAGLGAGFASSSIGAASLISFPALVAVGIPPVVANASNTIGLVPAGVGGVVGYRHELRQHPGLVRAVGVTSAAGAAAGALLLLAFPPGVFEAAVPWLILFGCLLVAVQPTVSRWAAARAVRLGREVVSREEMSPATVGAASVLGVYGGYFGAGQGVIMVGVLSLGLDIPLAVINALKTLAIFSSNVVATFVFLVIAELDWRAIALIGIGSLAGGYLGALVGRRLPPALFRACIVIAGVVVAALML